MVWGPSAILALSLARCDGIMMIIQGEVYDLVFIGPNGQMLHFIRFHLITKS